MSDLAEKYGTSMNVFQGKACLFCANNIIDFLACRKEDKIRELINDVKKSILILVTNLYSFKDIQDDLKRKVKSGVKVWIATLNPAIEYARNFIKTRHTWKKDEKEKVENELYIINEMRMALELFHRSGVNNRNYQIKVYENITLSIIMIAVDSEKNATCKCMIGYLLNHIRSQEKK